MYHYGGNNPVRYVDPTGEFVISLTGVFLIASVGVLVTYFTALNAMQGDDNAHLPVDIRSGTGLLSAGKKGNGSAQVQASGNSTDNAKLNILTIKAKDRREQDREKTKVKKHLDPDWEEPASEEFAKWKAQEAEKIGGKEARRQLHDAKQPGEPDRSKSRLEADNE